jgi:hypothetical protein
MKQGDYDDRFINFNAVLPKAEEYTQKMYLKMI